MNIVRRQSIEQTESMRVNSERYLEARDFGIDPSADTQESKSMWFWCSQAEEIGARFPAALGSCGEVESADVESVLVDTVAQLAWETEEG